MVANSLLFDFDEQLIEYLIKSRPKVRVEVFFQNLLAPALPHLRRCLTLRQQQIEALHERPLLVGIDDESVNAVSNNFTRGANRTANDRQSMLPRLEIDDRNSGSCPMRSIP